MRAARAQSSSACDESAVIGFSTSTCLPASSARFTSVWCVLVGVAITTASTRPSAIPESAAVSRPTSGNRARTWSSRPASASTTQTTSLVRWL